MTITVCSMLVMLCSILTGLIVEAVKKMGDITKPNITTAAVSVIVGAVVSIGYILYYGIAFNAQVVIIVLAIIVLSWLCAMLGYDKVMQTLAQVKGE